MQSNAVASNIMTERRTSMMDDEKNDSVNGFKNTLISDEEALVYEMM